MSKLTQLTELPAEAKPLAVAGYNAPATLAAGTKAWQKASEALGSVIEAIELMRLAMIEEDASQSGLDALMSLRNELDAVEEKLIELTINS